MNEKVQPTSPSKVSFVDFGKQYRKYQKEIDKAISECLNNGELVLQRSVYEFEERLANFVGTKYAVALNSGTDALYLSLLAAGIGTGDRVLVPSHTFVATAQVIRQVGATPVFVDMGGKIEVPFKLTVPVHIAGELDQTLIVAAYNFDTNVIEDACQALGAVKNPTSLAQCWSFYPAKILGCFGDGGAVTTNSRELADEIRELRNHYKKDYSKWGINSRLDNIQAAVLNVKLGHIDEILGRREEVAKMYLRGLRGVILPSEQAGRVWQDFIVRTSKRNELYDFLKENGVETMKNEYPMPIEKLPNAKLYEEETLRIPCNDVLEDDEVNYVIKKINEFFEK